MDAGSTREMTERSDKPTTVAPILVFTLLAALLSFANPSQAEPERPFHASPHLDHTNWIAGIGAAQYNAWNPATHEEPNHTVHAGGVRGFFEVNVIEHILEIELSAAGFWDGDGGKFVTADLLFKKSFEIGDYFNPYIAAGPSLSVDILPHEETSTGVGAVLATGAYIWITDHVGLDVDLAYGLISRPGGTGQELTIAIGPAIRF